MYKNKLDPFLTSDLSLFFLNKKENIWAIFLFYIYNLKRSSKSWSSSSTVPILYFFLSSCLAASVRRSHRPLLPLLRFCWIRWSSPSPDSWRGVTTATRSTRRRTSTLSQWVGFVPVVPSRLTSATNFLVWWVARSGVTAAFVLFGMIFLSCWFSWLVSSKGVFGTLDFSI